MTREQLLYLLRHPEGLSPTLLVEVRQLVELYPYCASFVFLYLYGLSKSNDVSYPAELKRLSIHLPVRSELYRLVEHEGALPYREPQSTNEDEGFGLIDHFLNQARSEGYDLPNDLVFDHVESHQDYFSQDELTSSQETLSSQAIQTQAEANLDQEVCETKTFPSQSKLVEDEVTEELFTETLAKIYIKQGRYDKALKMMQALSLNYPEKSRYFAHQIRFLERLLINSENNNTK